MSVPVGAALGAAWSAGVAAAALAPAGTAAGPVALALTALALSAAAVVRPVVLVLAIAAATLGVARVDLFVPAAMASPLPFAGHTAALVGRIVDDPRPHGAGVEALVAPDQLEVESRRFPPGILGDLAVEDKQSDRLAYGDSVEVFGTLRLPAETPAFDRRAYLRARGVSLELQATQLSVRRPGSALHRLPDDVRRWYRAVMARFVPQPYDALLAGVVLGIKTGIPTDVNNQLIATGLVHLLVLSGLKVAIFARLVGMVLEPVLGRLVVLPSLALVSIYALVGGATPAAVRAAAMGCLVLLSRRLGRPTHVWTSLSLTAAAMLGWHPELAWDVGFQLSFAGTAAIVLLTPWFERRLAAIPHLFREPLAVTAAAQIGTVPVMAADFHVLSLVAPLANALTLPLLPAVVALGLVLAPLSLVPPAAASLGIALSLVLEYVVQVAALLSRLPLSAVQVPSFPPAAGVAYYSALGAALVARHRGTRPAVALACSVLLPVAVGLSQVASWQFSGETVSVLNVGDGQAVLASGPAGTILVDGGSSPARLADELGRRLPPWQRSIDGVFLTAPTRGHVGGFVRFAYDARYVFVPSTSLAGSAWRNAAWTLVARGAEPARLTAGSTVRLAGLQIQVVAPEASDPGDETGVGYLAMRIIGASGRSFCDLSDLDADAQAVAAARLRGRCDYLLLPSGGASLPAPELLAAAGASTFIASSASGRIARELSPLPIRRTAQEGTIVVGL